MMETIYILPAHKLTPKKSFTDAEALQIIEYVQGYPFMFNHKMTEHQDRQLIQTHWRSLGSLLNATAEEVQGKFRNLRTQYFREKKKEYKSQRSDAGNAAIYFSKWKFFPALAFLDTVMTSEDSASSPNNGNSMENDEDDDHSQILDCCTSFRSPASSPASPCDITPSEMRRPLKLEHRSGQDALIESIQVMRDLTSRQKDLGDEEEAFAHMVAIELQRERDETKRRRKKAAICQILFT